MTPKAIVHRSIERKLDMIAICDHNSAENALAAIRAGASCGLCVLPGMEICSKEEAHILAIFKDIFQAIEMQRYVYEHLSGTNNTNLWGYQIIADENDEVMGENERLLISATSLSIHQIAQKTHELGGISIPSHVDRSMFGIVTQLGFIPPDLEVDAIEVSFRMSFDDARKKISSIGKRSCVTSSDAHFISDIGRAYTKMLMADANFEELYLALRGADGRYILNQ
jgi:predicted metal-dependent phosphoesterase TrpH